MADESKDGAAEPSAWAPTIVEAPRAADLAEPLGELVARAAEEAVKARGRFTVAVSGGSLPKNLALALATQKDSIAATSPKWHVFYADERCVPLSDNDSTHKVCSETLYSLDFLSVPDDNVAHINTESLESAAVVAADYTSQLEAVFGKGQLPCFDLILLGMGPDGHTASLFPGHPLLDEADAWVASIEDSPKPPPKRVTLTFPVINNSRQVAFVCGGGSKAESLKAVLETTADTVARSLPSARVRPTSGKLTWFVDAAANALASKAATLSAASL